MTKPLEIAISPAVVEAFDARRFASIDPLSTEPGHAGTMGAIVVVRVAVDGAQTVEADPHAPAEAGELRVRGWVYVDDVLGLTLEHRWVTDTITLIEPGATLAQQAAALGITDRSHVFLTPVAAHYTDNPEQHHYTVVGVGDGGMQIEDVQTKELRTLRAQDRTWTVTEVRSN